MVIDAQEALIFNEGQVWERQTNEPTRAYAAFVVYRDMGVARTVYEAYRRYKSEEDGTPQGAAPKLQGSTEIFNSGPASNWKRWQEKYKWKERATAWDDAQRKETEERQAAARAALWEERRQQHEALQKVHYERILRMNELIKLTLDNAQPLAPGMPDKFVLPKARNESEAGGKVSITEMDLVRQLEVLCEQEREVTGDYFAGLYTTEEEEKQPKNVAALIGKFEWVPDPSLTDALSEASNIPRIPVNTSFIDVTPDSKD